MGIHSGNMKGIFWKAVKSYVELRLNEEVSDVLNSFKLIFGKEMSEEVSLLVDKQVLPKRFSVNSREIKFSSLLERVWDEGSCSAK